MASLDCHLPHPHLRTMQQVAFICEQNQYMHLVNNCLQVHFNVHNAHAFICVHANGEHVQHVKLVMPALGPTQQ